jgi:XTP/dITP diphosphohydrolase
MPSRLRVLLATSNADKAREIRQILAGVPVELSTLAEFPHVTPPEETGRTFAENARLKALAYAEATGLTAAADDSGLEIEALDGAPGVRSARFGSADARTFDDRFAEIYRRLRERGVETSRARFVSAVAVARPSEVVFEAEAAVDGLVAPAPRGDRGFGYDPIFYYPPLGRTFGEATSEEKNAVSARGRAFRRLRDALAALAQERANSAG